MEKGPSTSVSAGFRSFTLAGVLASLNWTGVFRLGWQSWGGAGLRHTSGQTNVTGGSRGRRWTRTLLSTLDPQSVYGLTDRPFELILRKSVTNVDGCDVAVGEIEVPPPATGFRFA